MISNRVQCTVRSRLVDGYALQKSNSLVFWNNQFEKHYKKSIFDN